MLDDDRRVRGMMRGALLREDSMTRRLYHAVFAISASSQSRLIGVSLSRVDFARHLAFYHRSMRAHGDGGRL